MKLTHNMLTGIGLCETQLDVLRELIPQESFTARESVDAYIEAGHYWADVARAYQALVNAGRLPDAGLIWRVARIAFREQPERNVHLRKWADDLHLDNWRAARISADAADADAYADGDLVTSYAAAAASDAADYAADAYANASAAAYAAGAVAFAAGVAAYDRVTREILDMIVEALERQ